MQEKHANEREVKMTEDYISDALQENERNFQTHKIVSFRLNWPILKISILMVTFITIWHTEGNSWTVCSPMTVEIYVLNKT